MLVKVTDVDPRLPHQIIIMSGRTISEGAVSCNCLRIGQNGNAKPMAHVPYGEGSLDQMRAIYNDPKNHNQYMPIEQRFHPAIVYAPVKEVNIT